MAEHANVYPLRREPQREPQPGPRPQEPLWREVLGRRLRALRQEQQETLSETAARLCSFQGGFGLAGEFGGLWCTKATPKPQSTPILRIQPPHDAPCAPAVARDPEP